MIVTSSRNRSLSQTSDQSHGKYTNVDGADDGDDDISYTDSADGSKSTVGQETLGSQPKHCNPARPVPALSYAWSLFDEPDFDDGDMNRNNNVVEIDESGVNKGTVASISGAKRKHVASDDIYTWLRQSFTKHAKYADNNQDSKRAKAAACKDTSQSKSSNTVPATIVAVNVKRNDSLETLRIREMLEFRARTALAISSMQVVRLYPQDRHRYDPLQYFRMMAANLNAGCFTDLCDNMCRFFSEDCVFRAMPV
jgi:hypothetical protein